MFSGGIGLIVAIPALVEALHYTADWMLNGKLICLHRDAARMCGDHEMVWAIGEVADTEDVGEDKNPIEDIDNDYAMNVILAPFDMMAFGDSAQKNLEIATEGVHPPPPNPSLPSPLPRGSPAEAAGNAQVRRLLPHHDRDTTDRNYRAWTGSSSATTAGPA